jgi:hypothetical protein
MIITRMIISRLELEVAILINDLLLPAPPAMPMLPNKNSITLWIERNRGRRKKRGMQKRNHRYKVQDLLCLFVKRDQWVGE